LPVSSLTFHKRAQLRIAPASVLTDTGAILVLDQMVI